MRSKQLPHVPPAPPPAVVCRHHLVTRVPGCSQPPCHASKLLMCLMTHHTAALLLAAGIVETEFFSVRAFGDPEAAKRATSQFKCLEPADIADAIVWCLSAPAHMEVDDVVVRPTEQLI